MIAQEPDTSKSACHAFLTVVFSDALIEILATRTNAEIDNIKSDYREQFRRDLIKDLMDDTSGGFERLLLALANGSRDESSHSDMVSFIWIQLQGLSHDSH